MQKYFLTMQAGTETKEGDCHVTFEIHSNKATVTTEECVGIDEWEVVGVCTVPVDKARLVYKTLKQNGYTEPMKFEDHEAIRKLQQVQAKAAIE